VFGPGFLKSVVVARVSRPPVAKTARLRTERFLGHDFPEATLCTVRRRSLCIVYGCERAR
jgi:hypothetical protein